jgi:hypothetical protein
VSAHLSALSRVDAGASLNKTRQYEEPAISVCDHDFSDERRKQSPAGMNVSERHHANVHGCHSWSVVAQRRVSRSIKDKAPCQQSKDNRSAWRSNSDATGGWPGPHLLRDLVPLAE